jgi:hypothetical protein
MSSTNFSVSMISDNARPGKRNSMWLIAKNHPSIAFVRNTLFENIGWRRYVKRRSPKSNLLVAVGGFQLEDNFEGAWKSRGDCGCQRIRSAKDKTWPDRPWSTSTSHVSPLQTRAQRRQDEASIREIKFIRKRPKDRNSEQIHWGSGAVQYMPTQRPERIRPSDEALDRYHETISDHVQTPK